MKLHPLVRQYLNIETLTLQEFNEFSLVFEAMLNRRKRRINQGTLKKFEYFLNHRAQGPLLGKQVIAQGVMRKVSSPLAANFQNPSYSVSESLVVGEHRGFAITDLYDDEMFGTSYFDPEELELITSLREKVIGRYAVCHLINSETDEVRIIKPEVFSVTRFSTVVPRAAGSVQPAIDLESDIYEEDIEASQLRIIDLLPKDEKKELADYLRRIENNKNILSTLVRMAPNVQNLLLGKPAITQSAIAGSLTRAMHARIQLAAPYYQLKEIPVVIYSSEGSLNTYKPTAGTSVGLTGISFYPKFSVDPETNEISTHNGFMLCAEVYDCLPDPDSVSEYAIPIEFIKSGSFKAEK